MALTVSFLYVEVLITHARERRRNNPLQHEVVGCSCWKVLAHAEFAGWKALEQAQSFKAFWTVPPHGANDKLVTEFRIEPLDYNAAFRKVIPKFRSSTATAQLHFSAALKTVHLANLYLLRFPVLYPASILPFQEGQSDSPWVYSVL
jgi:hypothetical protein